MNPNSQALANLSRREMLKGVSSGFGYLALAGLCAEAAEQSPLAPKTPHFAPRAKRVIFLCMRGGPSHVDTFDYKPQLQIDEGKPGIGRRGSRSRAKLLGSPWEFARHGQNGLNISELFPNVAKHADKLCLLNGMHTDLPNHPQAFVKMHTGNSQFVRPSLGAWTLYGLGTENKNLPGFIVLSPQTGLGGAQNYGSSFLPAIYQATPIRGSSRGGSGQINNITNPRVSKEAQRIQLDLVQSLNQEQLKKDVVNPAVEGVIESFELAFRMQSEVPQLMDINKEPAAIRQAYGIGNRATESFGRQCLLARRMAEAGVRFIELNYGNWDQHRTLKTSLERNCGATDQPIAALLADLEKRDMLKDTLVMWGGEFGRTPHAQNGDGRDHNNKGYTMWMAGGGVKGGIAHGKTDEYGYAAVDGKMHIHDWHATVLHLLGLNHKKLTFNYAGRDFRLTDVHGNVAKEILA
ncbi:MAG: DUF1501 domain-containing protein [Verrucomicrobiota bacterium]|nr:DUF1501 domain-containing protein [Verrucomicrobiota bacterium]